MACLYILFSEKTGKFYIGSTQDMERRLSEHNRGQTRSTSSGAPWKLVFKQDYFDSLTAHRVEIRLKAMKSKRLIEKIVNSGSLEMI